MNATHPARQMALVGEAGARGDLGQSGSPLAHELDGALHPEADDVAVRSDADGLAEYTGEMERAQARDVGQRLDTDGLIQVGHDMLSQTLEHMFAESAPHAAFGC